MSEICPSILRTLSGIPAEGCSLEKYGYKYRTFSLLYVVDSACWLHDIEKKCLRNDFIYTTFKQSPEFPRLERLQRERLEMNVHISRRSLKTGLRFCRLSPLAQEVMEREPGWRLISAYETFHLFLSRKKLQKSIIQQKQSNNKNLSHKTQRSSRGIYLGS